MSKQLLTIEIMSGPVAGETLIVQPDDTLTIGRDHDNNLSLEDDLLSRYHARIDYREDDVWLVDLGSSNGTFVNSKRVVEEHVLTQGDRIRIGSTTLIISLMGEHDPLQTVPFQSVSRLHINDGPLADQDIPLIDTVVSIGRQPDNDIALDDTRISRYHARIEPRGSTFWVKDLNSRNGTYVNDERITGEKPLTNGDLIEIGPLKIIAILLEQGEENLETIQEVRISSDALISPRGETFILPMPEISPDALGFLSIVSGTFKGEIYPINGRVSIGNAPSNDIVLKDEGISKSHALIVLGDGTLWIEDNESRNGTWVNDHKITERHHLIPGDKIRLGIVDVVFESTLEKARAVQQPRWWNSTVGTIAAVVTLLFIVTLSLLIVQRDRRTLSSREINQVAKTIVQLYAVDEVTNPLQPLWVGSGTLVSEDGQILTNCHVACDAPLIVVLITQDVELPPVPRYIAEVIDQSDEFDLAILAITTDMAGIPVDGDLNLPSLPLNFDKRVAVGDPLYIFGYPTAGGLTITITTGAVSGFEIQTIQSEEQRITIKTDAKISSGNSGGAAINGRGELIGVPTTVNTDERTNESIPLVRPVSLIELFRDN